MQKSPSNWPELDYTSWSDTLDTLHQWLQIVGKIRLKTMPWQNHSWHAALYVSPSGFTTRAIPFQGGLFKIDFNFVEHYLSVKSSFGKEKRMKLAPKTVADFYNEIFDLLENLGLEIEIHPRPNELPDNTRFAENKHHQHYDAAAVTNFWRAMVKISGVFENFRSSFIGKCSPVHLFWGAFDLAVTRFSGRPAPLHPGGMPNMPLDVMQEAYSQEVSSAGFWPGAKDFPQPAFYAYCYPSQAAFGQQKVLPKEAFWSPEMGEYFLTYAEVQKSNRPEKMLLEFLETTYVAAAETGSWDRKALEMM